MAGVLIGLAVVLLCVLCALLIVVLAKVSLIQADVMVLSFKVDRLQRHQDDLLHIVDQVRTEQVNQSL